MVEMNKRALTIFLEALVDDINFDIKVALKSLERPAYAEYRKDEFFH